MRLYKFHRRIMPILQILNRYNIPFFIKSSNPLCHGLFIPSPPNSLVQYYDSMLLDYCGRSFLLIEKHTNYYLIF